MYWLTKVSLRFPKATLSILLLITAVLAVGVTRVRSEYGYRVLLGDDHPSIRILDEFIERYGGGLPIIIAWECGPGLPCSDVFDEPSLEMAYAVTQALSPLPEIRLVESPASSALLVPSPDGFAVRRFMEDGRRAADADGLGARAIQDPFWAGTLVSPDRKVGAMVVQPIDTNSETDLSVFASVQEALAPFEARGFGFNLAGDPPGNIATGQDLTRSTSRLIPFTVALIAVVLLALCRSWHQALTALATMGVALIWTFGALGWLGWPQDGILEVLAPLILIIGVCDAIHLLSRYAVEVASDASGATDRRFALLAAARDVASPCLFMSLTTGVAFASFATSALETFVRFGVISAFGVMVCCLLTFSLLPILARALPSTSLRPVRVAESWNRAMDSIIRTSERRAVPILAFALLSIGVCAVGWVTYLRVDTAQQELFGETSSFIRWVRFVEERLRPSETLEIEIELPEASSVVSPQTLSTVANFSEKVGEVEGIGQVRSVLDLISWLNRLIHHDDPAFERPGDTRRANAEIIELLSFEDPATLGAWVSFDRTRLRISAEAPLLSSATRERVIGEVRQQIEGALPREWRVQLSGQLAINLDWVRDVQNTQLRSFPTSVVAVFAMIAFFLRSFRLAAAAMIPTLLPVVVTLGAMGWLGMSLDVGRAMIATVIIGIADDDSIHILAQYKRFREGGAGPRAAMREAMLHAGRGVVTTSLALSLGFLTLMASAWQTISSFGFFVALAILGALAAVLFVLPALVFTFVRDRDPVDERDRLRGASSGPGRRLVTLAVVGPVALALGGTLMVASDDGARRSMACWVLPNALAMWTPGSNECPLRSLEQVRRVSSGEGESVFVESSGALQEAIAQAPENVRVLVVRDGVETWLDLPVRLQSRTEQVVRLSSAALIAAVLLAMPLFLLRRSTAQTAVPFAFFYSAISVIAVVMIGARDSTWLTRLAILAMIAVPATLAHLNLTFLGQRRVIREVPGLGLAPYVLAAALVPVGWIALEKDVLLWPAFVYLLIASTMGAGAILIASCLFSLRESASLVERGRARIVVYGAMLLPILPTIVMARGASHPSEVLTSYLWVSAVVMPLPVGIAISRYNLFDLGTDVRRWVGRLVYFAIVSFVASVVLVSILAAVDAPRPLRDPTFLFCVAFVCALSVEPLRSWLLGVLDSMFSPGLERLRQLREDYARAAAELRSGDEVARILGEATRSALEPRAGCVFVATDAGWCPSFTFGDAPPAADSLARDAAELLGRRGLVYLPLHEESGREDQRRLAAARVELIAAMEAGGTRLGLLLLCEGLSHSTYRGVDLEFVAMAASHAGVALRNARLSEELLAVERQVTTGRVALALAHDVGKEIDWVRRIARRLPDRIHDQQRLLRDLEQLREFTEGISRALREFVQNATQASLDAAGGQTLDSLVERVTRRLARVHGPSRISESIDPSLRGHGVPEGLDRVLVNLLDNALLASPKDDAVHLFATREGDRLRISITDRGPGVTEEVLRNAFKLGFTTRDDRGGSGVGLAISREIVEALGGTIELATDAGGGARATVSLPAIQGDRG
jgi:predicted RND superfamily exporter protein/signal transduction histidine kinase